MLIVYYYINKFWWEALNQFAFSCTQIRLWGFNNNAKFDICLVKVSFVTFSNDISFSKIRRVMKLKISSESSR